MSYKHAVKIEDLKRYIPAVVTVEDVEGFIPFTSEGVKGRVVMLNYNNDDFTGKIGLSCDKITLDELSQILYIKNDAILSGSIPDICEGMGPSSSHYIAEITKAAGLKIHGAAISEVKELKYYGGLIVEDGSEELLMKMEPTKSIIVAMIEDADVLINPKVIEKVKNLKNIAQSIEKQEEPQEPNPVMYF